MSGIIEMGSGKHFIFIKGPVDKYFRLSGPRLYKKSCQRQCVINEHGFCMPINLTTKIASAYSLPIPAAQDEDN